MSTPYERTGRVSQKSRTRNALVDATRRLLAQGITPTVEEAAEAASVSRPTAYRYFPNQRDLLWAAHPELSMSSLLPKDAPSDPLKRLDALSDALLQLLLDHETALRAMWRVSLERDDGPQKPLALRSGKRIVWVEDALAPIKNKLGSKRFRKLVLAIAATLGIEPLIWLVDIAGIERGEAAQLLRSSARALLSAAL
jgi:AcrR family transcriptional regulator